MTAAPLSSAPPLTVADYLTLPEDGESRFELQEGNLVMAPRPVPDHQICQFELGVQLRSAAPAHLRVVPDVDVDLELLPAGQPGTVRAPDHAVVSQNGLERVRHGGGVLRATDVVLAIEILSPSSRRTDSVMKHSEYADAGIGHYWIVDLDDGPSLTACHLGGEFGYVDAEPVKEVFETDIPFPTRVDLTALV